MGIRVKEYRLKAYAKINLGLDVVRKLENGYHQVKMVMQTVGIYDELVFTKTESGIALTVDDSTLPADGNNLVYKAVKLMTEHFHISSGLRIHLQKKIPIAAGMAGGSTDAAAAMKAVNRLFDLGCTKEELMELGVCIGADVPYCILGGTALAEGIGEKLTALVPAPGCHVLVAKPDISVSTKYVYGHLDAAGIARHPDIDGMVEAIRRGSLAGVTERMENVLESVTIPAYPVIESLKGRMRELGAQASLMSGSGPTVFGIFTEKEGAENAGSILKEEGMARQVFVTEFC